MVISQTVDYLYFEPVWGFTLLPMSGQTVMGLFPAGA